MMASTTNEETESVAWHLDPAVRIHTSDSGSLLIRSGELVHRITDATAVGLLTSAVLSSADGELCFPDTVDPDLESSFAQLLGQLEELGVVSAADANGKLPSVATTLYEYRRRTHGQLTQQKLEDRIRESPVYVVGAGDLTNQIRTGFLEAGVPLAMERPSGSTSLSIVVTEGMSAEEVSQWNEDRLADPAPAPWLLVQPFDGSRAFVGPLIFPRQTACQECFKLRRVSTFPDDAVSAELGTSNDITPRTARSYPGITRMQAGAVIEVALDHVVLGVSGPASRPGYVKILRADGRGLSLSDQRVLKVPRCPKCSLGRGTGRPQTWFPYNGDGGGRA
ncbi:MULTISPECIES: TOMM precursor leader peptide-binding protein [Auritidibacter]|uniref:TOMM leader peptide-binding protein n=1 Tax=Auritidibacter ignavus TaxID=678932 RepID=A0AAJ6DDF9_9MICC|nr:MULTISPECIES: TOMM precursor leader peptide-binding protein [Auritidibacter]AXR73956.1 hypothetical protein DCC27_006180 [Auritidibacter sp. NML130574]WGH84468.1 TOMM precursor leader peptide-binding protein [Auritidibacter ignavus]WGH93792.1 TOMM precursor leader peptide-binding protein [Auritidibacter ignavus]WHS27391.1 TOMM precursor leader peptide-binding protein [Auritidibacter ignavus]